MTDVERLIAAAAEPGPSPRLDERIRGLLAPSASGAVRPSRNRRREAVTLLATAACVGIIGFFLGRASALPPEGAPHVVEVPDAGRPEPQLSPQLVRVQLTDQQLADFFAPPINKEGAFGGSTTIISQSISHPQ